MNDLGKTMEEWEAEEAAERKTFKGKIKYAWEDYLYYPSYRFVIRIKEIPDDIKRFYQRGRRGWGDDDCWGVYSYLERIVPAMLRHMNDDKKGGGNSYPAIKDNPNADTPKHWDETIEKIARGFEASAKLSEVRWTTKRGLKLQKEFDEGMDLFKKYFRHLWD